jgi:hypothetical protein
VCQLDSRRFSMGLAFDIIAFFDNLTYSGYLPVIIGIVRTALNIAQYHRAGAVGQREAYLRMEWLLHIATGWHITTSSCTLA